MDALKALQSLGMGAEVEGPEGDKLLQQAQQIWSMLDDMADSDPQAYKRFIEKQSKEHQESLAPPKPDMCVKTKFQDGELLYVNVMSWPKVPAPKSQQDSIPLFAAPLDSIPDGKKSSASTVAITTNPDVLAECGHDAKNGEERRDFIHLCLEYVEHLCKRKVNRDFTLFPKETPFKGDLDKAQNFFQQSLKKAMKKDSAGKQTEAENSQPEGQGQGSSLMDQLSNIAVSSNGNQKQQTQPRRHPVMPQITLKDAKEERRPKRKALIQELGEEDADLREPAYHLEKSTSGEAFVLTVELPGVTSVSDCQLDISEDDVKLYVEGKYDLTVKLPHHIDDSEAQAKFSKKKSTLTLRMPVIES